MTPIEQSFEFKAAPLGGTRRVVVGQHEACLENAKGELLARIRYDEIDRARYVTWSFRHVNTYRLDLYAGDELFRVSLSAGRSDAPEQPPVSTFYEACEALLEAVCEEDEDFAVEYGEGGGIGVALFCIGVLALLMGVGIPLAAFLSGVRTSKLLGGLVPAAFLLFVGWMLCKLFYPWRAPAELPAKQWIEVFRKMREPDEAPSED